MLEGTVEWGLSMPNSHAVRIVLRANLAVPADTPFAPLTGAAGAAGVQLQLGVGTLHGWC